MKCRKAPEPNNRLAMKVTFRFGKLSTSGIKNNINLITTFLTAYICNPINILQTNHIGSTLLIKREIIVKIKENIGTNTNTVGTDVCLIYY